ncbi:unnamed protein product, partial [Rotaria sordida]
MSDNSHHYDVIARDPISETGGASALSHTTGAASASTVDVVSPSIGPTSTSRPEDDPCM